MNISFSAKVNQLSREADDDSTVPGDTLPANIASKPLTTLPRETYKSETFIIV